MNTVAILQARTTNARLPSKVMMDLAGEPLIVRQLNRTARAKLLGKIIVAIPTNPRDDVIWNLCNERGFLCTRGSEDDVLDRYYQTALAYRADNVVRMCINDPFIDPVVIDKVVAEFYASRVDYASNFIIKTYPVGMECEVMRFAVLKKAWQEDTQWREHVTPYIYKNPDKFTLKNVVNGYASADYSGMRWTVDTPEDLEFVRKVYDHFGHDRFSWWEVLALLAHHPEWTELNKNVVQRTV